MPLPRASHVRLGRLSIIALVFGWASVTKALVADAAPAISEASQLETAEAKHFLPVKQRVRIEAAFARVDRVMLCPQLYGYRVSEHRGSEPDKLDYPLVDIHGSDKVLELITALDLEAGQFVEPCFCYGSYRMVFMRGDHYLFELSYHHLSRLRGGYDVPYAGDIQLSDKGAKAVVQWFKANGFAELEKEALAQEATLTNRADTLAADHARLAALLPEKARTWLPAFDRNRNFGNWSGDEHVAALLGCFGNEQEGVVALWRMLGMNHARPHGDSSLRSGEPAGFLSSALDRAKPESLLAAVEALNGSDNEVRLGAFLHALRCHLDRDWKGDKSVMHRILTTLMREGLDAMDEYDRYSIVSLLCSAKPNPAPTLLASELERALEKFAAMTEPTPSADSREGRRDRPLLKLLALALEVRDSVLPSALERAEALSTWAEGERNTIRTIKKLSSLSPDVGPDDLLSRNVGFVNLPLLSWRAYRAGNSEPSLRMLGAALNSPAYEVRDEARKVLRDAGVELEESSTERIRNDSNNRRERSPADEWARLQEAANTAKSDKARAAAFNALGDFLLAQGEYESALIAFRKANAYGSLGATLAGVALGRPNEGSFLTHLLTRSADQSGKFIARGASSYAVGHFADASEEFWAASMLAENEAGYLAVAAELIGRLAGKPPAVLRLKAPKPVMDADYEETAVSAYIRGAISKEEFIRRRSERSSPANDVFTWWVVAQMARISKDKAGESEALRTGITLGAHASVWHVLMINRMLALELE